MQCRARYAPSISGLVRSLLRTIFVADPGFRASLDTIKLHAVFKKVDWEAAKNVELLAPWLPDESFPYHNCNERAQVSSRGVLSDRAGDIAKFVFLNDNQFGASSEASCKGDMQGNNATGPQDINHQGGIHGNHFVKIQKEKAMQVAMNSNMLPSAKGIVDDAFLEKNRVVPKRRKVNPLGNFWQQNLDQIFKDF